MLRCRGWLCVLIPVWAICAIADVAVAQQGLMLSGVGPINRAMGGASVAAPIGASGALHWNPATIMGLRQSELEFGVELLYPEMELASSYSPGALGGGFPPVTLGGSTDSNSGLFAIPTVGFVHRLPDENWSFGLGVFGIGGFGTNYAASLTNPILTPTLPDGVGLGALYSKLQVMQIAPTVAYQLTDNVSVGIAPTVTAADLTLDPMFLAAPDDANGDNFPNYPSGTHGRTAWGMGVQGGIYVTTDTSWNFGASLKSPQWMQSFHWSSADELGRPRDIQAHFDLPWVASVGTSYNGFERIVLAADARYYSYASTAGFDQEGFGVTGAVQGLGWNSIFSVALGGQYQATDNLALRLGYVWNQNPVPDKNTLFNVISPNILMHTVSCGLSYQMTSSWSVNLAYLHAFENSIAGPLSFPGIGTLLGTKIRSTVSADAFVAGLTVKF